MPAPLTPNKAPNDQDEARSSTSPPDWAGELTLTPTPAGWVEVVLADFDTFLQDHASCEKKASGMALNIAAHYRDQTDICNAMADLAVEELSHYREVVRMLHARGQHLGADTKDPYINALTREIRKGPAHYLMDRLLLAAIVERRGHERFGLLAAALPAGPERRFFAAITASENRHWQVFLQLAIPRYPAAELQDRCNQLVYLEGKLMLSLPARAALH